LAREGFAGRYQTKSTRSVRLPMTSLRMQASTESRVVVYDVIPERGEDLGYVRHQLDALAYARGVCGLRPKDETEYQRLCERERAMLEAIHQLVAR
jgi:hypothetical protein